MTSSLENSPFDSARGASVAQSLEPGPQSVATTRGRWGSSGAGLAVGVLGIWAVVTHMRDDAVLAGTLLSLMPVLFLLTVIDVAQHRLPNKLTLTAALMTTCGALVAALINPDDLPLVRIGAGALAMGVFYLALALIGHGRGMGWGDVKLAPTIGALAAWAGPDAWVEALFGAFLGGGVFAMALIASGRGRHAHLPFGPFMIGALLLVLAA